MHYRTYQKISSTGRLAESSSDKEKILSYLIKQLLPMESMVREHRRRI